MLTRYKQLYNGLTHSLTFQDTTDKAKKEIDKDNFTPHNLKAIILGANGAVCFNRITTPINTKRIEHIRFKDLYSDKQAYLQSLTDKKGMVDALIEGLRFNYVEEILLFKGGFAEERELLREIDRLKNFLDNSETQKSLKRLTSVALLSGTFENLIGDKGLKLNPDQSIIEQLKKVNIPIDNVIDLEPERTKDLNLLLNQGLDTVMYPQDEKLKKYFEAEKERAEQALKDKSAKQKKIDIEEKKKAEKVLKDKEAEDKKIAEAQQAENDKQKLFYIQQLKKQGYKLIEDKEIIAGNDKIFSKVFNWLKQFCVEKPDPTTKYKYKTCNLNSDLLKEKGVKNTVDANIWSSDIFTKDEDLMFRLFVKENDLSFSILMKLPVDLNEFSFTGETVNNIALIFSNKNRERGKIFQSSILEQPEIKSLQGTRGIDCVYDAIEISLVKDLMDFRKSNWLFKDYLKACNGETTNFSTFKKLPLGDKIVVGVKPNALKIETFDSSGVYQTSGIICGQAGSGKSALMDSLVVQFMALQGDMGNGSVILMDAKQEWPPLWREVLQAKGIPFYGFDGGLIANQEDIKQQVIRNGKTQIIGFSQPITQEVGGMIFVMTLYQVIQGILKKSGCKDIKTFNKANINVEGITRLPRIAIFIDEMNTFSVNATNGSVAKNILNLITGGANLTRTAGYMWFLCGQDVPKSIISAEKRGSFKYNIMGTMDRDRYEYFEVTENPAVKKYEERNATAEVPHPIMTQGTFYAGQKGSTELVRSMFLPDEEKGEALDLLNTNFEGMFELDALVRYALNNNLFDEYTFGVNNKNNIIYATLRDIGVISDSEFAEATDRLFAEETNTDSVVDFSNIKSAYDDNEDDDYLNEDIDLFGTSESTTEKPIKNTTNQMQGNQKQVNPVQIPTSVQGVQRQQKTVKPNKPTNTYNGFLQVKENPFELYKGDSVQNTLLSMREITKIIMDDIKKNIGDSSLIKEFKVTQDGVLVFDNIAYQPQFDDNFLESLPMTLKEQVKSGQLIEMFDLGRLYDFNNLTTFVIEDEGLAQGRARKEMGIGFRKRYSVLFNKFKYLNYIKVGHIEYNRENPDTKVEQGFLEKFKIDPASTFSPNSSSRMDKVWDSKPVRVLTNAFGWTMGVQAVWMATALFGPIGLLFGGLALSGAVLEARKEFKDTPTGNKDKGSQNKNNKW